MMGLRDAYLTGGDALGAVMEDNPLVVTPGYTLDRMNRFDAAMATFQRDVWRELPGKDDPFSLAFGAFKMQWDRFYKDAGSGVSGFASRLWGSTADAVINYERRLEEWKERFRAEVAARGRQGRGPTEPGRDPVTDPTMPQRKPESSWVSAAKIAKTAAIVGVAGASIYVLGRYVLPLAFRRRLARLPA